MGSRQDAQERIAAAGTACNRALESWRQAHALLKPDVSVNGFGVIHDKSAFRQRLAQAKVEINAALAALEGVEWPSDADYDNF